jgi:hypothetical protein
LSTAKPSVWVLQDIRGGADEIFMLVKNKKRFLVYENTRCQELLVGDCMMVVNL